MFTINITSNKKHQPSHIYYARFSKVEKGWFSVVRSFVWFLCRALFVYYCCQSFNTFGFVSFSIYVSFNRTATLTLSIENRQCIFWFRCNDNNHNRTCCPARLFILIFIYLFVYAKTQFYISMRPFWVMYIQILHVSNTRTLFGNQH